MDSHKKCIRIKWTQQEEQLLKQLAKNEQVKKWVKIAKQISALQQGRTKTPKQCRQKYVNHIQFFENPDSLSWTEDQVITLFNEYKQKGSKWKLISFSLPNKSENCIKNKFYGAIRKFVRKLNTICKKQINKNLKPIQDRSILRIINLDDSVITLPTEICNQSRQLKQNLFRKIKKGLQDYENWEKPQKQTVIQLINKIHSFNSRCRYFCSKNGKLCRFFQVKGVHNQPDGSYSSPQTQEKIEEGYLILPFVKMQEQE